MPLEKLGVSTQWMSYSNHVEYSHPSPRQDHSDDMRMVMFEMKEKIEKELKLFGSEA